MMTKVNSQGTTRKTAIVVGILFIIGTVAGILSAVITGPLFDDPNYLTTIIENQTMLIVGAICVLTMGFSLAMVPVMVFPIMRKYNETLALGSVLFRGAIEAGIYIAMVITWLLLLILSQEYVSAGAPDIAHYQTLGNILLQADDLMNPILQISFCIGALMFYYLFFQTRLIPRWLSAWGLIGALPYLASAFLALFGFNYAFLMIPLAVQEMVFAVWLVFKGFDPIEVESLSV